MTAWTTLNAWNKSAGKWGNDDGTKVTGPSGSAVTAQARSPVQ